MTKWWGNPLGMGQGKKSPYFIEWIPFSLSPYPTEKSHEYTKKKLKNRSRGTGCPEEVSQA
jgi:hypothetical protein